MSIAGHACFYDASALVKQFTDEEHSADVREFWRVQVTRYTTPFCFHETLTTLKVKWLNQKTLTRENYLDAALRATTWYRAANRQIDNPDLTETEVFVPAFELVKRYELDLSDACQIVSVKHGFFSHNAKGSQTLFVTADARLAEAARTENLRVWHVGKETWQSLYG